MPASCCNAACVCCTLDSVSAFHLPKEGKYDHSELTHRVVRIGSIHSDRVRQIADAYATFC